MSESDVTIEDPVTPIHGSPAVHDSLVMEKNDRRKRKSDRWDAWQNRYLATKTLAEDPYQCAQGQTGRIWESIGENLLGSKKFPRRSGAVCKQRVETLIKRFGVGFLLATDMKSLTYVLRYIG